MSERFFVTEPVASELATLGGAEAHHLLHVVRAKPGQEVILFDGTGREFTARIEECSRREVRLRITSSQVVSREPRTEIVLGVGLPKGDRQRWLVEKATELGVASVVPLVTDRSVAKPTGSALERLRRAIVEASKQCCRTRLMQIAEPEPSREFFAERSKGGERRSVQVCAHVGGEGRLGIHAEGVESVQLAVGPEGGFTDEEIAAARDAGWTVASLGPRVLRVETAAVALAAAFTLGAE